MQSRTWVHERRQRNKYPSTQIPCFRTTEATNPIFFLISPNHYIYKNFLPHGLGEHPITIPCSWPRPISKFSRTQPHFQWNMTYIQKHKTDYSGLLTDPLYTGSPSITNMYYFFVFKKLQFSGNLFNHYLFSKFLYEIFIF
jgi:hypothetical protein